MCPTSHVVIANRYRSLAEHPLSAMDDAGPMVSINTDDPAMQDLDLGLGVPARRRCPRADGWRDGRLAVEGIESTWLDASDRAAMRREFEVVLAGL